MAPIFLPPSIFPTASPSVGVFFQEASFHLSSPPLVISTHFTLLPLVGLLHRLLLSPFFVLALLLRLLYSTLPPL
ncbi:uncharacterized protein K441DRAFT_668153 [Cenococcum geophilum 1.58]|uniref:uncharacterized protein n=1 Tax=Cenococcum geophilum 1.58 TaxID=794803 RepID=UPI00358E1206|nr:hypothetical protein K441DRAFT_668153 [Cenococcum geophilum 1.58]